MWNESTLLLRYERLYQVAKNAQSAMLNQYFNTAGYSCAMYIAWNPKDNYGIIASVYVVQFNAFMSLTS
jgi:hypothetical protein